MRLPDLRVTTIESGELEELRLNAERYRSLRDPERAGKHGYDLFAQGLFLEELDREIDKMEATDGKPE